MGHLGLLKRLAPWRGNAAISDGMNADNILGQMDNSDASLWTTIAYHDRPTAQGFTKGFCNHSEGLSPLNGYLKLKSLKRPLANHFATAVYSHKDWQRFSARLLKHKDQIFTFLDVPGVPPDNNHAERAIRPHVIVRNRSFQNRTDAGAHAHSVLTSLVQTLLLQKRSVIPAIASAYLARRHGATASALFTSVG